MLKLVALDLTVVLVAFPDGVVVFDLIVPLVLLVPFDPMVLLVLVVLVVVLVLFAALTPVPC